MTICPSGAPSPYWESILSSCGESQISETLSGPGDDTEDRILCRLVSYVHHRWVRPVVLVVHPCAGVPDCLSHIDWTDSRLVTPNRHECGAHITSSCREEFHP